MIRPLYNRRVIANLYFYDLINKNLSVHSRRGGRPWMNSRIKTNNSSLVLSYMVDMYLTFSSVLSKQKGSDEFSHASH